VQQYEEERERIFQAASVAELKEALPDRTLPIHQQLEVALRLLVERSRLLVAQEIRVAMLESNAEKYKLQISISSFLHSADFKTIISTNNYCGGFYVSGT
jgi:hypothetical protein